MTHDEISSIQVCGFCSRCFPFTCTRYTVAFPILPAEIWFFDVVHPNPTVKYKTVSSRPISSSWRGRSKLPFIDVCCSIFHAFPLHQGPLRTTWSIGWCFLNLCFSHDYHWLSLFSHPLGLSWRWFTHDFYIWFDHLLKPRKLTVCPLHNNQDEIAVSYGQWPLFKKKAGPHFGNFALVCFFYIFFSELYIYDSHLKYPRFNVLPSYLFGERLCR